VSGGNGDGVDIGDGDGEYTSSTMSGFTKLAEIEHYLKMKNRRSNIREWIY